MPVPQQTGKAAEAPTGLPGPRNAKLAGLVTPRAPELHRFADDGQTPNNPILPLAIYRDAVERPGGLDAAEIFEVLFATNEWQGSWRNGIYDFLHFHTGTHEVLGIARGRARVQFGGDKGRTVDVAAGDVVVLPAGTGHRRISASGDLLVVGAYPASAIAIDEARPGDVDHEAAVRRIARVPPPASDPVYGRDGPLMKAWNMASFAPARARP